MRMGLRQVIKKKDDGEGETLSLDFADRLRTPVEGEDALVAKLANSGASAEDLDAATGAIRLLKSLGASFSIDQKTEPIAKTQKAKESTVTKPTRTAAESLAEVERIQKDMQISDDAKADQRIEDAAVRLRRANPSLSKAQSVVNVLKADPDLYAAHARHSSRQQAQQMGYPTDDPRQVQKADDAWSVVVKAATELRKSEPSLTEPQAVARLMKTQPELFEGVR